MSNVEQNARICLLIGTWLEILDVPRVILCGDDRFILWADDHLSASFARLYAIREVIIREASHSGVNMRLHVYVTEKPDPSGRRG